MFYINYTCHDKANILPTVQITYCICLQAFNEFQYIWTTLPNLWLIWTTYMPCVQACISHPWRCSSPPAVSIFSPQDQQSHLQLPPTNSSLVILLPILVPSSQVISSQIYMVCYLHYLQELLMKKWHFLPPGGFLWSLAWWNIPDSKWDLLC